VAFVFFFLVSASVFAAHVHRIREDELDIPTQTKALGEGSFSEVRRGTWTRTITVGKQREIKVPVAVKSSKLADGGISKDMARDLAVITSLPHQNIVIMYGVCEESKTGPKLVCELMSMDLAQRLKQCDENCLQGRELLRVLRDVSAGLAHLHKHNVFHRDVKPANVLLGGGGGGGEQLDQVKLCDFGSSKDLNTTLEQMTQQGTVQYMAPEMYQKQTCRSFCRCVELWRAFVRVCDWRCVSSTHFSGRAHDKAHDSRLWERTHRAVHTVPPTRAREETINGCGA